MALNKSDYKLLLNICYHCLRSNNLTYEQRTDIDNVIGKLYNELFSKESQKCCGKKLKVGAKKKATELIEPK